MNTSTETLPTTATTTTLKTSQGKSVSEALSNSIAEENSFISLRFQSPALSSVPFNSPTVVHSPGPFLQTPTFPPQSCRIFPLLPGLEVRLPCEDPVLPVESLAIIGASVLFVVFSPRLVSPASEFNRRGKPHAFTEQR